MKKVKYFCIGFIIFVITVFKLFYIDNEIIYISIANPENFIEINNNKWHYSKKDYSKIFSQSKFKVYSGDKYLGNYNIQYTDHWYIYDDDFYSIDYDDQLFISNSNTVQLSNFEKIEFDDDDINSIKHTLDKENIVYNDDINGYKINFDVDNDGKNEILYNVYSIYDYPTDSYLYNLIYIEKDDTNYYLEKEVYDDYDYYYSMLFHDIEYILKVEGSEEYNIVVYETRFSAESKRCYSVYNFKNNNVKTVLKADLDYHDSYLDNNITNLFSNFSTFIYVVSGIVIFIFVALFLKQKSSNRI